MQYKLFLDSGIALVIVKGLSSCPGKCRPHTVSSKRWRHWCQQEKNTFSENSIPQGVFLLAHSQSYIPYPNVHFLPVSYHSQNIIYLS